jgi:RNA recognition motif-containing protein
MTEMLDIAGRSKGSGVVRFELQESAHKAVTKFNGYVYGGRPLEVMHDRV